MNRFCLVLCLAALVAPPAAQAPAPAGETAPSWTAEEAAALALVQEIAGQRDAARAAGQQAVLRRVLPAAVFGRGYRLQFFVPDEDGVLVPVRGRAVTDRWCVYAWPEVFGQSGRRAFFVASDGPVLITDNDRHRYEGDQGPEAVAALGRGGGHTLADVQRGPGLGQDRQLWRTAVTLARTRTRVLVLDGDGRPLPGLELALLPESGIVRPGRRDLGQGLPLDFAVPVGRGRTGADGALVLAGPPARGVHLGVRLARGWLTLRRDQLQGDGRELRLRLTADSVQQARITANEEAAIATLKNLSSAQAQCQAIGAIDADGDGAGEYGFFAELSGAKPVRSDDRGGAAGGTISPPVLSGGFARVRAGTVTRSGYVFLVLLPKAGGGWAGEAADGGAAGVAIDPDAAEIRWRCYAWPQAHGESGRRVFYIDQHGDVLAAANGGRYSGDKRPAPGAALLPGPEPGREPAANAVGGDGQRWIVVR